MVIIHTNNLAQKLLYLSFHFQNAVDCQAFLLSFTWRRGFQFLHIMLWDSSYGSVHFWNHPGSSPPHLVLILPSQAPFSYFAPQTLSSDLLWHLAYISKYLSTPSPSLFLFLPLSSPLLETNQYKGRGRGVRNCSSLFLRTKVGQERLCPRNMWRLIQFARACRSCKYLWATEKELTQAHRLKEAGRGLVKHQWPQMLLPGRQVQLAARGASLLGGRWQECGKSILASGAAEFFSLPFLYPQPISNFQPLGGFRDQFSSQKLPTPPIRLLLAWMTDLYFWGEETYAHPLLPTSAILSSVRKHQGMHNFSHLCTQAHASCFKV